MGALAQSGDDGILGVVVYRVKANRFHHRAIAYGRFNHRHSRESGNPVTDAGSFAAKIQQITSSGLRPRIKYGVTFFRRSDVAVILYAIALDFINFLTIPQRARV